MFARVSALLAMLALPLLVAAGSSDEQCNTGSLQCCNSLESASNPSDQLTYLASVVGATLGSATGQVGVTCSPLTVVGLNNNQCTQQPVCCTDNSFNGVVALGCSPINAGL